jgi:hypothetical protein
MMMLGGEMARSQVRKNNMTFDAIKETTNKVMRKESARMDT